MAANKLAYRQQKEISWKAPVVAASAIAVVKNNVINGFTLDGIVLVTENRVLLKDQVVVTENGLYIVQAANPPVRSLDMTDAWDIILGSVVPVLGGTVNGQSFWMLTTYVGGAMTFLPTLEVAEILEETPAPACGGGVVVFTLAHNNTVGSTKVYLNGQRQFKTIDYNETAPNKITFVAASMPLAGDELRVDYKLV